MEDCLEDSERVLLLLLRLADQDLGPQEARVLVIDLLVGDVALQEAVTVLVKNIANIFVDNVVSCFFTFSQDYEVITALELFCFLLIAWRLRHWQVVSLDLRDELLEVLVHVEVAAYFRFPANEEFDRDWRCLVIITREPDWDVDGENISW